MTNQPLMSLTYMTAEKRVGWIEQSISRTDGTLALYRESIHSANQMFPLQSVFDCSHKPFSDGTCLFYLHTNHGVRTFHVTSDPAAFERTFRKLKSEHV
ncbi:MULTISPECIES: hypothetical protein [Sporosarcina]|uniref:hypothetical protein n=1 Tax=Sporosarcina TaxID=1569 RepID=UPI000590777F|nr:MULTISPECIES: hypothetical protein [Sporosarcina]WJY27897.1 hypothetical protein QWT68_02655 [Sporosarcina sp. 0.2-SM1T-5]